jgi:hypothetical protein
VFPWRLPTAVPAWLLSAIMHLVALLALALVTFQPPEVPISTVLEGTSSDAEEMLITPIAFEAVDLQDTALLSTSLAADLSSKNIADASQMAAAASALTPDMSMPAQAEIGELFAAGGGQRMGSSLGSGSGNPAQFFGVKATGRRFVFIVDSSNSMRGGKFDAAKEELKYSIRRLSKDQAFYIIFFDQNAERMLLPPDKEPPVLPVLATTANLNRVDKWIATVENQLRTDPYDAVKLAVEMVPDAIYLLTDGKFTDRGRTERFLKSNNIVDDPVEGKRPKVVIHTLCFWQADGEDTLKAIAKDYGGTYRFVPRETKKSK